MTNLVRPSSFAITLSLILWILAPNHLIAQSDDICPPGDSSAVSLVTSFSEDSDWAEERQELGISVNADQIRVLSNSQDSSLCRKLAEMFPEVEQKARMFYKAGSYYFVIYKWTKKSDGTMAIGSPGFIILNDDFDVLRFYL